MTGPLDALSRAPGDHSPHGDAAIPIQEAGVDHDKSPAHTRVALVAGMDAAEGAAGPAHARVVLAATAVMSLGVVVPVPTVRALLVLPVALLAPGYALLMALFGDARRTGLDPAPLLALSILLSLACYPLLALLLHLAALPIATGSVVGATDAAIMLLLAGSAWRSPSYSPGMAPRAGAPPDIATAGKWEGPRGGIRFAAIAGVAGLILAATLRLLPAPVGAPYTMFYLAGRSAYLAGPVGARGYRAAGPWERCAARARAAHLAARTAETGAVSTVDVAVGVTNGSARRRSYHVVPLLDGVPCWRGQTLSLRPGASWSGHIGGEVAADGTLHRLTITLHQVDQAGQPDGGGQDGARVVGPLVVWVQGARRLRATHGGPRQSSRPRQARTAWLTSVCVRRRPLTQVAGQGPDTTASHRIARLREPRCIGYRQHRPRLIRRRPGSARNPPARRRPGSASNPPARHGPITGSAPVRRARLYAMARSPSRQSHVVGSAGGVPAWYRLHTGWGHRPAPLRGPRAARPCSQLSDGAPSRRAAVVLLQRRAGRSHSRTDHLATTRQRPRSRNWPRDNRQ